MQGRRDRRQSVATAVALATAGMMTASVALGGFGCRAHPALPGRRLVRRTTARWTPRGGYSPLAEINKNNVSNLQVAWIFQPGESRQGLHCTPLVVDGAMYISTNPSTVWKLDAATGKRIWSYKPGDGRGDRVALVLRPHPRSVDW